MASALAEWATTTTPNCYCYFDVQLNAAIQQRELCV